MSCDGNAHIVYHCYRITHKSSQAVMDPSEYQSHIQPEFSGYIDRGAPGVSGYLKSNNFYYILNWKMVYPCIYCAYLNYKCPMLCFKFAMYRPSCIWRSQFELFERRDIGANIEINYAYSSGTSYHLYYIYRNWSHWQYYSDHKM